MVELTLDDPDLDSRLQKSESIAKVGFDATVPRGVQTVFKAGDDFVIWGPASVEVVDKEGDKISVEALDKALPQLLKRARLSLDHTDQIVGRILERFQTAEPVEVEIADEVYERDTFPTKVLDLEDDNPPALYVAGEVFDDTEQSRRARERIENGELTSYSISGEALVTRKQVDEGVVYDDIIDMDLSAVTLCEEGMNQGAHYERIDGDVSDKELAGEAATEKAGRRGIPAVQSRSGGEAAEVSKSKTMFDDIDGDPSIEDVLKRLPDEGELATKDDLEDAKTEAAKAVREVLPDGDIATIEAMEQRVEEEVESQVEATKRGEEDEDKQDDVDVDDGGDEDADVDVDVDSVDMNNLANLLSDVLDVGVDEARSWMSDAMDKSVRESAAEHPELAAEAAVKADSLDGFGDQFSQLRAEKSVTVTEARDKIAQEFGVEPEKVNRAVVSFLEREGHDFEDDEDDVHPDEGDDDPLADEGDDDPLADEGDDEPVPEDDGDDEYERFVERLKEDLPDDVAEVVEAYVGKEDEGSESDVDDGLNKAVVDILQGTSVDGADAIPTGEMDDTVGKQYDEPDEEVEGELDTDTGTSPGLAAIYGKEDR